MASRRSRRKVLIRWLASTRTADERSTCVALGQSIIFAVVLGFVCDAIKPAWWPEWRGYIVHGNSVYLWYALFNCIGGLASFAAYRYIKDWYTVYFAVGLAMLLPGLLANTLELGLIPIVWHGAIGFFIALTIAFRRFFDDLRDRWNAIPITKPKEENVARNAMEIRKELVKEMQWAFTTHLQVWLAFTAIFGVSMTILFKDGNINQTDLKGTAVQMTTGFATCLTIAYCFGLAYALNVMQDVRRQWSHVLLG